MLRTHRSMASHVDRVERATRIISSKQALYCEKRSSEVMLQILFDDRPVVLDASSCRRDVGRVYSIREMPRPIMKRNYAYWGTGKEGAVRLLKVVACLVEVIGYAEVEVPNVHVGDNTRGHTSTASVKADISNGVEEEGGSTFK